MPWVTDHHPTPEGLASCVQCGLCLPVCPTFRLTGRETASPRGRLQAMIAVADGVVGVDEKFEAILDFCLGCRACEPVCPGMVPYGELLEGSRAEILAQVASPQRRLRGLLLKRVVPSRRILRALTVSLAWLRRIRSTFLLPARLRRAVAGLRPLSGPRPEIRGAESGAVGLLVGCVQHQWFPTVNAAAFELLERAGHSVAVPEKQTCCGALAAHDGHADVAQHLARRNDEAFQGCEVVVATAAGCSAHLRDRLGDRAMDITRVIAEAIESGRLPTLPASGAGVVVQDPCHLRHAQRSIAEQRLILSAAGYELFEIGDDGMCCGAAGLYTVLQPEASTELGRMKAERIRRLGVGLVASANPGCEMQLRTFLGDRFLIRHPVELYRDALDRAG